MRHCSLILLTLLLAACGGEKKTETVYTKDLENKPSEKKGYFNDCRRLFLEAQKLDSTLFSSTSELDRDLGNKAMKAFTDYAYYCDNDTLSPVFLIKTSQVARALNNLEQAKFSLEKCIEKYPRFPDVPAAMFLLAQLFDENNYMNNEAEAKKWYEEIISKYPNSPEAQSAKGALRFIGKSDEEIMKELKKEAKQQERNFQVN